MKRLPMAISLILIAVLTMTGVASAFYDCTGTGSKCGAGHWFYEPEDSYGFDGYRAWAYSWVHANIPKNVPLDNWLEAAVEARIYHHGAWESVVAETPLDERADCIWDCRGGEKTDVSDVSWLVIYGYVQCGYCMDEFDDPRVIYDK